MLIRNKLIITPNTDDKVEQIKKVASFCEGVEDKYKKTISFEKISPKPIELINESKEEDDWLLNNWGTRFKPLNACWVSDNEMIFDTFWNPAIPIFIKLIKQFPKIDFTFKFASKKTGQKAGNIKASSGNIVIFNKFDDYSKQAYETAFELMPHLTMLYIFNQKENIYEYDTSDFRAQLAQNGFYKDTDGSILIDCDDKQKPLFDRVNDLPF